MKTTTSSLLVLAMALTACGSRQGVPGTATKNPQTFQLSNAERPTRIGVREGDTVYGLAYKWGITSRSLIAANDLQPPYALKAGQELNLPAPQEHVVIAGEDATGIAAFYGVDVVVLARENRLSDNFTVKPGDRLVIPTKDTVARDESVSPINNSAIATSSLAPLDMGTESTHNPHESHLTSEIAQEKLSPLDIQSELRAEIAQESTPANDSLAPLNTEATSSSSEAQPVSHTPMPASKPQAHKESDDDSITPIPPVKAIAASASAAAVAATHIPNPIRKPHSSTPAAAPAPKQAAAPAPVAEKLAETPAPASRAAYLWPAKGKVLSTFGEVVNGTKNDGVNIALPEGSPVVSSAGGEVVYAGNGLKGFGNLVLVKHSNGYMTAYGHNSRLLVQKGEIVQQGQKIAEVGSTGDVNTPQLHFELRKGTQPIDPMPQLGS